MNKLANQLIQLGCDAPDLRPHLRPVLAFLKSEKNRSLEASMDMFDMFDVPDEEIVETPAMRWSDLQRGAVVKIGKMQFQIFKSEGLQKYATMHGTKGRKQYMLTPLTGASDPEVGVYEVVGSQVSRDLLVKGKPVF